MAVPPSTDADLAEAPDDATFGEAFGRGYAMHLTGSRDAWVGDLIAASRCRGVADAREQFDLLGVAVVGENAGRRESREVGLVERRVDRLARGAGARHGDRAARWGAAR